MPAAPARLALAAAVLLALAGCGQSGPDAKAQKITDPDKATSACRSTWKDLGDTLTDPAERTTPSTLPDRWNTVAATVDYYATSASEKDCGQRLDDQKAAITALKGFETKLRPYDVPARLAQVHDQATAYAARPAPKVPKKLSRKQRAKLPPTPAAVAAALKAADAQAATATQQQGPGWEQAGVVDLGDSAAVAKAVKDLAFLSSESAAYRVCAAALATIARAIAAG